VPSSTTNIFRALADPTRRAVLDLLLEGEKNATQLAARFSISQQAVSLHLQSLRKAGVVQVRRDGRHRRYRLKAAPILPVYEWSVKFKPLFDPYGHAWLIGNEPTLPVRWARVGNRTQRRRQWS
jgi:DNA-binding transcriptional ArsR family regulator